MLIATVMPRAILAKLLYMYIGKAINIWVDMNHAAVIDIIMKVYLIGNHNGRAYTNIGLCGEPIASVMHTKVKY